LYGEEQRNAAWRGSVPDFRPRSAEKAKNAGSVAIARIDLATWASAFVVTQQETPESKRVR